MNALISQIIDLEHRAQELVQEADEKSRAIADGVEKDCAVIEAEIKKRQKTRLEKTEEAEKAAATAQLNTLKKEIQSGMTALSAQFAEKKDAWADEIFQNIIGLKHVR